jgi:hypothetical protein
LFINSQALHAIRKHLLISYYPNKYVYKLIFNRDNQGQAWQGMHVVPSSQKAEGRGSKFKTSPGKVSQTPCEEQTKNKGIGGVAQGACLPGRRPEFNHQYPKKSNHL